MKKTIWLLLVSLIISVPVQTFGEVYTIEDRYAMDEEILFEEEELPTGDYIPLQLEIQEETTDDEALLEMEFPYMPQLLMAEDEEDLEFADVSKREYYGYTAVKEESLIYARVYRRLANGLLNGDEEIRLEEYHITGDEFEKVMQACINDHPELFYLNCSGGRVYQKNHFPFGYHIYSFCPSYIEKLKNESSAELFEYAAIDILKKSGARPGMSDYDKAIMIHNELAARIQYDNESLGNFTAAYQEALSIKDAEERQAAVMQVIADYADMHSAYNALVKGKAVCDGYAKAYQYLLRKVGIVSHMATGYGNGGGHAWNLVRLDGKWYYTDLTWDDNENGPVYYAYFNMTNEQLLDSSHELDNPYEMPKCTCTDLNYYTINGGYMSAEGDIDNVVAQLKENSYARVYYTGTDGKASVLWTWYQNNVREIANRLGITQNFKINGLGKRREMLLMLYHDTVSSLKNTAVEVCSMTDRECRVFAGFYDEEDHLIHMGEVQDVELKANAITRVKFGDAPEEYHTVKYFVWDSVAGLKPLYQQIKEEY